MDPEDETQLTNEVGAVASVRAEAVIARESLIERMRTLAVDHEPDGWPAVKMGEISALCDEIDEYRQKVAVCCNALSDLRHGIFPDVASVNNLIDQTLDRLNL